MDIGKVVSVVQAEPLVMDEVVIPEGEVIVPLLDMGEHVDTFLAPVKELTKEYAWQ
ncbi:hypothetical protein HWB05_gp169 [Streptomyces phage BRock]|uniref:Uncharacterized protein n=1 Tax=Streptomyces phage BRock TaxID=1913591 RepID=A0A1J0GW88_9CAUD|nr:hypothetical protein HWB05_gp169 [Streptomyces phage BRock]APC46445.1 hypothetical protein [Streptomyces phage BRock]